MGPGDQDRVTEDWPPSYEVVDQNAPDARDTAVNLPPQAAAPTSPPGPASSGKFFYDTPGECAITMVMYPDRSKTWGQQPWVGYLSVKCDDVPLLMREGFYWSAANVVKEESYFCNISDFYWKHNASKGGVPFRRTRRYYLKDFQQQRWVAKFEAMAPDNATLSSVRLDSLSEDNVVSAWAESLTRKEIYEFHVEDPKGAFNAIYDDMPLPGWWPWPKKRDAAEMEKRACDLDNLEDSNHPKQHAPVSRLPRKGLEQDGCSCKMQ
ncbi:hypothetical protein F4778DRAFT_793504 [Xylariomycetidae sp. FL2044]|nr:hypothetical protein F4778DRAFT_793504 [Xylariomycetidae sp. FL2044]